MSERGVLLVPQKDLDHAKSRMLLTQSGRRELAVAMLRRSLAAAIEVGFDAVVVVLDNEADEHEIADLDVIAYCPRVAGLNESLAIADRSTRLRWGAVRRTVMPADLPLATPELLDRALRLTASDERAFLPDMSTRGTTLLFAGPSSALMPAYGPYSAQVHERGGARLLEADGLDPLRHDVDDMADLFIANLRFEAGRKRWDETA
jgi:2-phospho-L-lactate guanylyltransferase